MRKARISIDSSDSDSDEELEAEYYFKASTSNGSLFAKMLPENDQLIFIKNTNTNNWQCLAMIENVCESSLIAFYLDSSSDISSWNITPKMGFIPPQMIQNIKLEVHEQDKEQIHDKLFFFKSCPLHFSFEFERASEYMEKCWKRENIQILFTLTVMYTHIEPDPDRTTDSENSEKILQELAKVMSHQGTSKSKKRSIEKEIPHTQKFNPIYVPNTIQNAVQKADPNISQNEDTVSNEENIHAPSIISAITGGDIMLINNSDSEGEGNSDNEGDEENIYGKPNNINDSKAPISGIKSRMISKGVQSDSSDTDTDDDKLGDEYYFQASTSSGSYFAKMMPEDDQLVFLKNTNTNNWQCQAMIENVCTESLVAFYLASSSDISSWNITPQCGFIPAGMMQIIKFEVHEDDKDQINDKLLFFKCVPLNDNKFKYEDIGEYMFNCWKRENIQILFTLTVMYTHIEPDLERNTDLEIEPTLMERPKSITKPIYRDNENGNGFSDVNQPKKFQRANEEEDEGYIPVSGNPSDKLIGRNIMQSAKSGGTVDTLTINANYAEANAGEKANDPMLVYK